MYAAPSPSNLSRRRHRQTSLRRWGRLLRSMISRALRRQEYATDMLEDEWRLVDHSDTWLDAQGAAELRPAPGNRQYVNKCTKIRASNRGHAACRRGPLQLMRPGPIVGTGPFSVSDDANQMMLLSDMVLAWDPAFRAVLEEYAVDERRLSHDFAVAFKKLTELGCERVLQPEVAS